MGKDEIENLRDKEPNITKVPGFSISEMRAAIEKVYKRCSSMNNYDKTFRQEVNECWWICMRYNGSIPTITISLERWMEPPLLKHLQRVASLLYMCNPASNDFLQMILGACDVCGKKKGKLIYGVTGGFVRKGN